MIKTEKERVKDLSILKGLIFWQYQSVKKAKKNEINIGKIIAGRVPIIMINAREIIN